MALGTQLNGKMFKYKTKLVENNAKIIDTKA